MYLFIETNTAALYNNSSHRCSSCEVTVVSYSSQLYFVDPIIYYVCRDAHGLHQQYPPRRCVAIKDDGAPRHERAGERNNLFTN